MWPRANTNGTMPCWGRRTTHFRTYFSGDWDVHWGYRVLTHSHVEKQANTEMTNCCCPCAAVASPFPFELPGEASSEFYDVKRGSLLVAWGLIGIPF